MKRSAKKIKKSNQKKLKTDFYYSDVITVLNANYNKNFETEGP